jgi:hypothetical protein
MVSIHQLRQTHQLKAGDSEEFEKMIDVLRGLNIRAVGQPDFQGLCVNAAVDDMEALKRRLAERGIEAEVEAD